MSRLLYMTILSPLIFGCSGNDYSNYKPAEAVITYVHPHRVIKSGYKPPRYQLDMTLPDGRVISKTHVLLSEKYELNDRLTVYYNPENPDDEITDKIR